MREKQKKIVCVCFEASILDRKSDEQRLFCHLETGRKNGLNLSTTKNRSNFFFFFSLIFQDSGSHNGILYKLHLSYQSGKYWLLRRGKKSQRANFVFSAPVIIIIDECEQLKITFATEIDRFFLYFFPGHQVEQDLYVRLVDSNSKSVSFLSNFFVVLYAVTRAVKRVSFMRCTLGVVTVREIKDLSHALNMEITSVPRYTMIRKSCSSSTWPEFFSLPLEQKKLPWSIN